MNGPQAPGDAPLNAGHIIGNRLGGDGTKTHNIFPQLGHFNQGVWSQVESYVKDRVLQNGRAQFTVKLVYEDGQATRPKEIHYRILSGDDPPRYDIILNPVIKDKDIYLYKDKNFRSPHVDVERQMKR